MNVSTLKCWGRSVLFFLMLTTFVPSVAKDVYGFMTGNGSDGDVPIGMYKYDTAGGTPELLTSLTYQFWGGTFADGKYMMILSDDASGYLTEGLCTYNLTPVRDKIAISCMLIQIREFSSHAITHELYIKNRKRLFCL